ncbi:hypothetical protein PIB30_015378, partial [Stylosanthes scabra]|nr:hypothetical protein [Stylosanthes scabra]
NTRILEFVSILSEPLTTLPQPTESPENSTSFVTQPQTDQSPRSSHHSRTRRKLTTALMLSLISPRRLSWGSSNEGQEKVELTVAELESLRSELTDLEEREAHLKARVEHVDEVLRSARLSGYLYIRTRWEALPGEPPPIDDAEVDDWLPRFVVLHGECIFLYLLCTDLSPQDSTLLSDIVEVGSKAYVMSAQAILRYRWNVGYQLFKLTVNWNLIHQLQMFGLRCNITDCRIPCLVTQLEFNLMSVVDGSKTRRCLENH